jgi:tetratricopeptide (TPR) repeat protein
LELGRLGRYEIRGELGRGTMGVVYRGHDPVIDRAVALKSVLVPSALPEAERARFFSRFMLEAQVAGKLIHPNIVVTYDAAIDPASGLAFIAMELVEGESLARLLEVRRRLDWRRAVEIGAQLAAALDHAHRQGVVHRDLKPANVLLTAAGVPKLADFGIAKVAAAELTQPGTILGTPYFMSPEQVQGDAIDGRSDIFSLGAVLYLLITGQKPFEGPDLAAIANQVVYKNPRSPSEILADVPRTLDAVLERAMAKSAGNRYPAAGELADHLKALAGGEEVRLTVVSAEKTAGPAAPLVQPPPTERAPRAKTRNWARLAAVLAVLAAGAYLGSSAPARARLGEVLAPTLEAALAGWKRVEQLYDVQRAERERRDGLRARAQAHLREGEEAESRGDRRRAEALFEESLLLSRQGADGSGEAAALLDLGRLRAHWIDPSKGRADLASAEAVYRIYGDSSGEARALAEMGNLEREGGAPEKALAFYEKGLLLAARASEARAQANLLSEMGLLSLLSGEPGVARERLARAQQLASEAGDAELELAITLRLVLLCFSEGTSDELAAGLARARHLGERLLERHRAEVLLYQGWAAFERDDPDAARGYLEEAERRFREDGHLPGRAAALYGLAALDRHQGRETEARARQAELGEIRLQLGFAPPVTETETATGGDAPRARLLRFLKALPLTPLRERALARLAQEQGASVSAGPGPE